MNRRQTCMCTVTVAALGFVIRAAEAAGCDALPALEIPNVEIRAADIVAAGAFESPESGPFAAATNATLKTLPEFCRATLTSRPSNDSEIRIEVWMPTTGWNGMLQSVGNGGWAGSIRYGALAEAVARGYAAASTDTGHEGGTVEFAIGHPEKLVDFAHRAVHEMTVAAKAIVASHYEQGPDHAYFVGCSTGGRQALAEAQRYPSDYDGIVAGAPAYHPSHLQGMQVWTSAITNRSAGASLDAEALDIVNEAVVNACDTLDGVADGVIENPHDCRFDPASLVCSASGGGDRCLTPEQVETVAMIYEGPTDSEGTPLFHGLARGSELGWRMLSGEAPLSLADATYRYLVFDDPDWDFRSFDAERDLAIGAERIGALMNSTDPDLTPFIESGGKLLLYHGWNDPGIPADATVAYYESVLETIDPEAAESGIRLFMVPGMNHCRGGVGTDTFDAVSALDDWVRSGNAPDRIEAARVEDGATVRTRPLCPYPETAIYDGSGSTNSSESFSCR